MTPAIRVLEKLNISYRLHSYQHEPDTSSYGMEAAQKLGIPANRFLKTLIVRDERQKIMVAIIPASARLDLKAVAAAAGAKKISIASPIVAQRSTGYVVGGISPFGQRRHYRTFLERSAMGQPQIFVSAGRRGVEISLRTIDLIKLVEAEVASIALDIV